MINADLTAQFFNNDVNSRKKTFNTLEKLFCWNFGENNEKKEVVN